MSGTSLLYLVYFLPDNLVSVIYFHYEVQHVEFMTSNFRCR